VLNEEATRYLHDFPEEMIFHTSDLHMLECVGQGKNMTVASLVHTRVVLKFLLN